jgi:hypothetical protein
MNNSLDKLIGNDELLTYICLILAILNTLLMSMVINDTNSNFNIYIFLLFEALFLIFIVYFLLKKKDVYSKDDDIKYDWYFYLRVSIIILVFFNFALYIYNITNDSSTNPKKGGSGSSRFQNLKTKLSNTSSFLKNIGSTVSNFLGRFRKNNKVVPEQQNNLINTNQKNTEALEQQYSAIIHTNPIQAKLSKTISKINSDLEKLRSEENKLTIRLNDIILNYVANIGKQKIGRTYESFKQTYKDNKKEVSTELEKIKINIKKLEKLLTKKESELLSNEKKLKRIEELRSIVEKQKQEATEATEDSETLSVSTDLTHEEIEEQKKFISEMKAIDKETQKIIRSTVVKTALDENIITQQKQIASAIENALGSNKPIDIDDDVISELEALEQEALKNNATKI